MEPELFMTISTSSLTPINSEPGRKTILDQKLTTIRTHVVYRYNKYKAMKASIEAAEGSLANFAEGYKKFGFNRGECLGKQGIWLREWIPTAHRVTLFGEFSESSCTFFVSSFS